MPKLKTHKGVAKVLKSRKSGTITIGHPGQRHNTVKKDSQHNRSMREKGSLSRADRRRLRDII